MAIRDILKISRKTFVNPTGWLDYESLKDQNRTIWGSIRNLFKTPEPRRNETFEAAIKRLNLTDEDVTQAIKTYHSYALLFFCIAFILFCYAFYLLFTYWTIPGWLLAMATCAFSLSQSFACMRAVVSQTIPSNRLFIAWLMETLGMVTCAVGEPATST